MLPGAVLPTRFSNFRRTRIRETLDRLQACADLDRSRAGTKKWRSLLEVTDRQYQDFRELTLDVSDSALERVAHRFGLEAAAVESGEIDFHGISARLNPVDALPDRYRLAAFSRLRTPITSLEFLETKSGWRARRRLLHHFRLSEASFTDPMALISHQFIMDFCAYLRRHEDFTARQVFLVGAHSLLGNRNTLLSEVFSKLRSPSELYELLFTEMMKFFEYNCHYKLRKSNPGYCVVDAVPNRDVTEAMGVWQLGNASVCDLKAGMLATMSGYLGIPFSSVNHTRCLHRGDETCRFEITYPSA